MACMVIIGATTLERIPAGVAKGRRYVRALLASAGLDDEGAELVVSELLTNALDHGAGARMGLLVARDHEPASGGGGGGAVRGVRWGGRGGQDDRAGAVAGAVGVQPGRGGERHGQALGPDQVGQGVKAGDRGPRAGTDHRLGQARWWRA